MRSVRRGRHWARPKAVARLRGGGAARSENPEYLVDLGRAYARAGRPEAVLPACARPRRWAASWPCPWHVCSATCAGTTTRSRCCARPWSANGSFDLAALSLAEAALREADAARWAFGAPLTPARQRNAAGGPAPSLAAALRCRGCRGRDRSFLTEALGRPPTMRASDPTWAVAADGGRSSPGRGRTCARHRIGPGGRRGLPRLCQRPEDRRGGSVADVLAAQLQRARPAGPRAARHAIRGGKIRGGSGRWRPRSTTWTAPTA
jgi:hypothetical protein